MSARGGYLWATVDEPVGAYAHRAGASTPYKVTAAVQAGPHPAGVRLVGLFASLRQCPRADAARAALPPYAARAAQPSSFGKTAQDAVEPPLNCRTCAPGADRH